MFRKLVKESKKTILSKPEMQKIRNIKKFIKEKKMNNKNVR